MAQPIPERWDGLDTTILGDLARRGLMSTLDVSGLKQHGVEKMFWLEPASAAFVSKTDTAHSQALSKAGLKSVNAPTKSVVYICRPEIKWMKAIAGKLCTFFRLSRLASPSSPFRWLWFAHPTWTKLAEPTRSPQR